MPTHSPTDKEGKAHSWDIPSAEGDPPSNFVLNDGPQE
jgi:hypothetical protein